MCRVEVELRVIDEHWLYNLSRFQCLTMALQDLKQLARGNKLQYVLDGYDFCNWFFPVESGAFTQNPYHRVISATWKKYFNLSDGVNTCAVMSPFTIIEFLHTITGLVDNKSIRATIAQNPDIQEILGAIQQREQLIADLPGKQLAAIRDLYRQILDYKRALDLFTKFDTFDQLKQLFQQGRIRIFDPLVPDSAQVIELLAYDEAKTRNAISYLRHRREGRSGTSDLYNTLDAYHFVLVENSRRSLSAGHIVPYLTSSGVLSRNSWYMLKYNNLPDANDTSVPLDWNVRSGDVPGLLLSALLYNHERIGSTDRTEAFLEDAKSVARMIRQDLFRIPEIQRCRESRTERKQLLQDNPRVAVSSHTVELMRRLYRDYLAPIEDVSVDIAPITGELEKINQEEVVMMQEFLRSPARYETLRRSAVAEISNNVRQLKLPYPQLHSYIAPLGEDVEELWTSIKNALDLDAR